MNNLLLSLCLLLVVLVASVKGKGGGPFRSAKASRGILKLLAKMLLEFS